MTQKHIGKKTEATIANGRPSALNTAMARHKMPIVDMTISTVVGNPARSEIAYLLKNKYRQLTKASAASTQSLSGILSRELDLKGG